MFVTLRIVNALPIFLHGVHLFRKDARKQIPCAFADVAPLKNLEFQSTVFTFVLSCSAPFQQSSLETVFKLDSFIRKISTIKDRVCMLSQSTVYTKG